MKRCRLKNAKEAGSYRAKLLKEQGGIDPITGEKVKDAVLDHNHGGDQECRAVLERTVNSWEGKVLNSFNRYVRHHTDKDLPTILRNLADYYERDNSDKPIHHTALTKDANKFKSLPAAQQCSLLEKNGIVPESNSVKRTKQARKLIKDGILVMKEVRKGE